MSQSAPLGRFEGLELPGVAILISVAGLGVHLIWAVEHCSPVAFQRGGTLLTIIGAVLVGLPYLKMSSIDVQAADRLPPFLGSFVCPPTSDEYNQKREMLRPAARGAVIAERFVAFGLIVVGTFVSGYGDVLLGARF